MSSTRTSLPPLRAGALAVLTLSLVALVGGCGAGDEATPEIAVGKTVTVTDTTAVTGTPTAVVDGDRVLVAWGEYDEKTQSADAFVATSDDHGATFSAPRNVTNHGGVEGPQVAAAADGTLFMAALQWADAPVVDDFYPAWVRVYRSTDKGRTWKTLGRTPGPAEMHVNPYLVSIAVSDDGAGVLVSWQDATPPERMPEGVPTEVEGTMAAPVWASVSADGGTTFGPPEAAAPSSCKCCGARPFFRAQTPSIAYRAVRFIGGGKDQRNIAVVEHVDGGWRDPVELRDDEFTLEAQGCPASGPGVSVEGERLTTAWWTGGTGREGFWIASGTPTAMEEPRPILREGLQLGDLTTVRLPSGANLVVLSTVEEAGHDHGGGGDAGEAKEKMRMLRTFVEADGTSAELEDGAVEIPMGLSPMEYSAAPTTDGAALTWIEQDGKRYRVRVRMLDETS